MVARMLPAAMGLALLATPLASTAASAPPLAVTILTAEETEDARIVAAARLAYSIGGHRMLDAHIPALTTVLSHAPTRYPMEERRDGVAVTRSAGPACQLHLSRAASSRTQATCLSNIYPDAAALLGAHYAQKNDTAQALEILDKGLSIQPNSPALVGERNAIYAAQRRYAEVVEAVNDSLAAFPVTDPTVNALLLRNRGGAHLELGELDAAEADFTAALRIVPDNAAARKELAYIDYLRDTAAAAAAPAVRPTNGGALASRGRP